MKTLALCIPSYNAAWCLPKLFDSVRRQTIPFDEILVYDDCSTDDTIRIASEFGATVISGRTNRGCSHGKNQLALQAKSDWLFFLDSDDELLPEFSSCVRQVIADDDEKADMILLNYVYVDGLTNQLKDTPNYDRQLLYEDPIQFMIRHRVINSAVINRTKFLLIGGFDTDPLVLFNEDRAFSIKTALNGFRHRYLETPCIKINYYAGSMSAKQPTKWIEAALNLWEKLAKQVEVRYQNDICNALFIDAAWAAKYKSWPLVKRALKLAKDIKADSVPSSSKPFQLLFWVWPFGAFFIRENLFNILRRRKQQVLN